MAWRETTRAMAATVRRRYRCKDCGAVFDHHHASYEEEAPDCPGCTAAAPEWQPPLVAITTNKSRAIDFTQKMAEQDYGLTNMRDNTEIGETAALPPAPMQTAEREALTRELIQAGVSEAAVAGVSPDLQQQVAGFWNGGMPGGSPGSAMEVARSVPKDSGALDILEKGRDQGSMKLKLDVVGRST